MIDRLTMYWQVIWVVLALTPDTVFCDYNEIDLDEDFDDTNDEEEMTLSPLFTHIFSTKRQKRDSDKNASTINAYDITEDLTVIPIRRPKPSTSVTVWLKFLTSWNIKPVRTPLHVVTRPSSLATSARRANESVTTPKAVKHPSTNLLGFVTESSNIFTYVFATLKALTTVDFETTTDLTTDTSVDNKKVVVSKVDDHDKTTEDVLNKSDYIDGKSQVMNNDKASSREVSFIGNEQKDVGRQALPRIPVQEEVARQLPPNTALPAFPNPTLAPFPNPALPQFPNTKLPALPLKPSIGMPGLLDLLANLTNDWNLTQKINESLQKYEIPTCPTVTEATETTEHEDVYGKAPVISKCFVCGLKTTRIPYDAHCADAFSGDFIPLVPVNTKARSAISSYRKYCRYLDVPGVVEHPLETRSQFGRFTGGCSVRWVDLTGVYTQRACRNQRRPVTGKHFASKRMAKLEMAMTGVENGCLISPMATLIPVSRAISLYARFHACVCTGEWCNKAVRKEHWMTNHKIVSMLIVLFVLRY